MVATTTEEPETKITTIIIIRKEGSVTDHVSCSQLIKMLYIIIKSLTCMFNLILDSLLDKPRKCI